MSARRVRRCGGRFCSGHRSSYGVHSWLKVGSAARQRLLAIASAFDLSGAPIGKWSSSTSLVRKRSPVRIRAWAPSPPFEYKSPAFILKSLAKRSLSFVWGNRVDPLHALGDGASAAMTAPAQCLLQVGVSVRGASSPSCLGRVTPIRTVISAEPTSQEPHGIRVNTRSVRARWTRQCSESPAWKVHASGWHPPNPRPCRALTSDSTQPIVILDLARVDSVRSPAKSWARPGVVPQELAR